MEGISQLIYPCIVYFHAVNLIFFYNSMKIDVFFSEISQKKSNTIIQKINVLDLLTDVNVIYMLFLYLKCFFLFRGIIIVL